MNKYKIAIIGYGMVGKSTAHALCIPEGNCFNSKNKNQLISCIKDNYYDTFIFCLPTPTVKGKQDLSVIEEWLKIIQKAGNDPIIIIRSTILPGTTKKLAKKYDLRIVFVPEFLTEVTAIEDELNPEFLVIGADDILLKEQIKTIFLNSAINPNQIIECNTQTAEMIKYALNSFFGLKVVFSNQLWDVGQQVKADYSKIEFALENHKWGSKNGWNVWHGGFRGYSGKCLPKDIEAFSNIFNISLLKEVDKINKELIK